MAEPLLIIEHLRVDYPGVVALNDLCLSVEAGDIYDLIGPNGAGKTTTLRAPAGLQECILGTVKIDGLELSKAPHEFKDGSGLCRIFTLCTTGSPCASFWTTTRVLIACRTGHNASKNAWR